MDILSFCKFYKNKVPNFPLIFATFCLILSITRVSGHPLEVKKCGIVKYPNSGIVGGNIAQDGAYPWMVSIHRLYKKYRGSSNYDHLCGASIINEHWIVTAAHCIKFPDEPWKYEAIVGLHKISKKNRPISRKHKIEKIIVHEDYSPYRNLNDIALMRTLEPIDILFSRGYVNGICLPESEEDPEGWGIVTGWGTTYFRERDLSDELKTVIVPIIPRKTCNIAYGSYPLYDFDPLYDFQSYVQETEICAGDTFKDSCQGDSGGPLVQRDRNGVYTLIGIVSHGAGCGEKDIPGIYTKVASYLDWMEANIQN